MTTVPYVVCLTTREAGGSGATTRETFFCIVDGTDRETVERAALGVMKERYPALSTGWEFAVIALTPLVPLLDDYDTRTPTPTSHRENPSFG